MAAGDITYDNGSPRQVANTWEITGTIEVDDVDRVFAITGTKSRILTAAIQDRDGAGVARCDINVNAAGTATNGSLRVAGNHQSVDTYQFKVTYT